MEKGGKKKREKHKGHAFFKFTYYIHLFFVFMEIPQKINEKEKKHTAGTKIVSVFTKLSNISISKYPNSYGCLW